MWINRIPCCLLVVAQLYLLKHSVQSRETALVPPTPQIHRLTPDFISDTLDLEWYDGGSAFPGEINATWQIQILYRDPIKEVARETYLSKLTGLSKLLHWTWRSNVPFNCTTHYIRIRCQFHGNVFDGSEWSQWSQVASIPGKDTGAITEMYPIDRVVQVGSDVTFCCVWKQGQSMISIRYADCSTAQCLTAPLSKRSMSIHMDNVRASIPSGNNAWCTIQNIPGPDFAITGTVLFVGYPPDVPQNLNCKTQNSKEITCKWGRGRSTNLFGNRGTSYFLFERFSGENVTCTVESYLEHHQCSFPILGNQTTYNFTVQAINHLGQSKASFLINTKM